MFPVSSCCWLRILLILSLLPLGFFAGCSEDSSTSPDEQIPPEFQTVLPEEAGYSSDSLAVVEQMCDGSGYDAMMAVSDGKVFFSWGEVERNYWCHSIRKPMLSALIGFYTGANGIDIEATMAELEINDIEPSLSDQELEATVRQLMQSRSGVYHPAAGETQEMRDSRPLRGSHEPGTFFYYNNWDFNALGTIFQQITGTDIFEEFDSRIAQPIGMEDFNPESCQYSYEPEYSDHPVYAFRMSCRDMARFGVLYQKNGVWEGQRIIDEEWIEMTTATVSIMDSTTGIGFGYMWKTFPEGSLLEEMIGYSGYYHTGVGIHILIILPEIDLVIVQRLNTDGEYEDPSDSGMEIGIAIINARLEE